MTKQDKINFIKEWYAFKNNMCEKYKNCTECPLYESSDGWWGGMRRVMDINMFIIVNLSLKMLMQKKLLN